MTVTSYALSCARSVIMGAEPAANQDAAVATANAVAVFDGLGGHPGSEHASRGAAIRFPHVAASAPSDTTWGEHVLHTLRTGLVEDRATQPPTYRAMTCTAVCAQVQSSGDYAVAWCGDSRAYLRTPDGALTRLSEDHDYFFMRVAGGHMYPATARRFRTIVANAEGKSDAWRRGGSQAKKGYQKNHLMASELSDGPIDSYTGQLMPGSLLILTTDGVHDNLTETVLAATVQDCHDPQTAAEAIMLRTAAWVQAGDSPRAHADDVSVAVLGYSG
jgi:serine/threonine protein phosphatase PrpC